jgi:hypothetical protein
MLDMNTFRPVWLFVFTFLSFALQAQNHSPWKFQHEKQGVLVYTRKDSTTGIQEIKLRTEVQAKVSELVALTNDVPNLKAWAYRLYAAHIVRKVSDKEGYLYMRSDFPFPFSDRDAILHFTIKQDPVTKQVVSSSESAAYLIPENKGVIRVKTIETKWTFTPLSDGKVRLEYEIMSDPGGGIPKWIINLAADEAPVRSMLALKKIIGNYRNSKVSYVKD